jgi:hypothetical protein
MTELAMDDNQKQTGKEAEDRQPSDLHRRQRGKNIALGAVLFGLAVLFYIVAIVKMGGGG